MTRSLTPGSDLVSQCIHTYSPSEASAGLEGEDVLTALNFCPSRHPIACGAL